MGRNLFAKNPRVALSTFDDDNRPVVCAMEAWCNEEIENMRFNDTMQRLVLDALLCIGIGKVALATPADAATLGWGIGAGRPLLSQIDLDDFVFDHHARNFWEVSYIGHRFRAPIETIKDSKFYNKKARDQLELSYHTAYNRQGDEKIGMIGRGYFGLEQEFEDMVDLWEIYLPRHRLVVTLQESDLTGPTSAQEGGNPTPLRVQNWLGPDCGPYHILAYKYLPGNPFPAGPVQDLVELHEATNESYRKLVRQAARQKTNTVCRKNEDDGNLIQKANDGEMLPLNDPMSVQEVRQGGPDNSQFIFMKEMADRFSLMAGNLMTMGGLSAQAGTATQEELLASQSNGQVAAMQDATMYCVSSMLRGMLWYWWHDPRSVQKTTYGDEDAQITREIYPAAYGDPMALRKSGEMPKLKVEPYSMKQTTPDKRADDIIKIFTQLYIPIAQIAQQQGVGPDFQALFEMLAKLKDMPDLTKILTVSMSPGEAGPTNSKDAQGGGPKPSETTRNYVRRSLGGQGPQAQEAATETILESGWHSPMGGGPQKNGTMK